MVTPANPLPSGRTEGTGAPARADGRGAGTSLRIGDRVPLPPRQLDIRPAFTGAGKPSFTPARKGGR